VLSVRKRLETFLRSICWPLIRKWLGFGVISRFCKKLFPGISTQCSYIPREVVLFIHIRHSIHRIHPSTSLRRCFSRLCPATKILSSPRRLLQPGQCPRKHMGIRPDPSPGITVDTPFNSDRNVLWLEPSNCFT